MTSQEPLPIILVLAKSKDAANKLITEIVEDENGLKSVEDYKWHIENKYYEADVIFHAVSDEDCVQVNENAVEGLLIHLADDEGIDDATRRYSRCKCSGVRLVAQSDVSSSLATWGAAHRVEAVALSGEPPDAGVGRLRAALHAHVWPGLSMRNDGAPPLLLDCSGESSSGEECAGDEEEDEAAAVERAERFASALASLPAAAQHAATLPTEQRRRAAELLVAAFAQALGHPLD